MNGASNYFAFEKRSGDSHWLDLVRALAIAFVLARHGHRAIHGQSSTPPDILDALLLNGWIGVDLFFVLSGYLISSHLLRRGLGTGHFDIKRYLAMRALRIVPAYFAVIALILLGAFPAYSINPDHLWFRIIYHLLFLQDLLPSNINTVFWSLGVEEKFYLFAPVLVWFTVTRTSLARSCLVILAFFLLSPLLRAIAFASTPDSISYNAFFFEFRSPFYMTLEPLMAGVAIAVVRHARVLPDSSRLGAILMAAAFVALVAWLSSGEFMAQIDWFDATLQPVLIAIFCGALTLGAVMMGDAKVPFEPAVRVTARLSYSLYLVHYPLVPLALKVAETSGLSTAGYWIAYLATSLLFACLVHFSVEKPFLILKDRIAAGRRLASAD
jgi:peptidoglycan/LPS O-acetylase OafA/YrhL